MLGSPRADSRCARVLMFFFQAEDGIRDLTVTGVQTCALPISARKALPPINLGALRSAHGLAFAGGKLYFTAETNKAVGRYDPVTKSVDLVLGTGQDRTHMVAVSENLERIVTSNVSSGTISIIEQVSQTASGFLAPPAPERAGPTFVAGSPPPCPA